MDIETTALPGVLLVKPKRFGDERGFFSEVFRHDAFVAAAGPVLFVQDNHSRSAQRHTLRGLHFQRPPRAQGKLVRVGRGAVLDVAVDIRHGSPHYGRHVVAELSDANGHQLWVPPGFLHGFVTLTDETDVLYKVTEYYSPDHDGAVRWNDPDIGIAWPADLSDPVLSAKDAAAPRLRDLAGNIAGVFGHEP
jgi:dTDP-4-dehydrorhamnose 3,5-epimerase